MTTVAVPRKTGLQYRLSARSSDATPISTATVRERPIQVRPLPYGRGTDQMAASFTRFAKILAVSSISHGGDVYSR